LDALQFIPKTTRNDERKQKLLDTQSLSNLERWFVNHTGSGNRNKQLLKYAMVLVDAGKDWNEIRHAVTELNQKIPDKLDEAEIMATILTTVSKAISQRELA
ncbi:primase C-terminal domain-containing protein, partial [Arthrospira platensis SPKY1]|nr:primase C-terminal domain-containing protein [Arthrospira platensis SPKY1]